MQLEAESTPVAIEERRDRSWIGARHPFLVLFSIALTVRLAVALLFSGYFNTSGLVVDDLTYWDIARAVAEGTTGQWDEYWSNLYLSTRVFSLPLSVVYKLFGPQQIAGQIFVAVVGASSAVIVYLLARRVMPQRFAFFSGIIMALLPSLVIWSSMALKDAFVWTSLAITALVFANLMNAQRPRAVAGWLAAITACVFAIAYLRPHSLIVTVFALVLASWLGTRAFRWTKFALLLLLLIAVPWIRGFGPAGWILITKAEQITEIQSANAVGANTAIVDTEGVSVPPVETQPVDELPNDVRDLVEDIEVLETEKEALAAEQEAIEEQESNTQNAKRREELAAQIAALETQIATQRSTAQEAFAAKYDPRRAVGVKYIARGLSVMLFEPYPWDTPTSPSFRMAQAETIVWYPIVVLAFLGLIPAFRARRVMGFPLLAGGAALMVYALAEGNVGTAFRHRSEFTWVIALLAGFGLERALAWRRTRRLSKS